MWNPASRLVRLPLKLVPDMTVPILSGPLAGKRWRSRSGTHGCWLGTYEADLQRQLAAVLNPHDVFYDVGANVGFFSLLAASRGARVIAFEPLARNADLFDRNLQLNRIASATLVRCAVGRHEGMARFKSGASASMGRLSREGDVEVPVTALDAFLAAGRAPAPTVIKMDIEGAESEALAGARSLLQAHRPLLFLSTHGWKQHEACRAALQDMGYRLDLRRDGASDGQYELTARHPGDSAG
ncbi:FkbM family methyltransferase [Caenimonas aquaedulcis]|uniref:FkbM family methyltransferase n=1 Tax=Caenimonas aquaedulcis TaxID=2793270 RepID=A0A931MHR8_9BURK|nr:FkbM family methyltransferase [Caenimonas aquaedulcis]MBG9389044.1 FkbM family methyltransferase [Caenimonas aquaedulcis]